MKELPDYKKDIFCSHSCHLKNRNRILGNPMDSPLSRAKASMTRKRLISEGKVKFFGHGIAASQSGEKNYWWGKNRSGKNNPRYIDGTRAKQNKWYAMFEWKQNRKKFFEQNKDRGCTRCQSKNHLTVDHIIPYRISKSHAIKNLQILCSPCHGKKTREDSKKEVTS